MSILSAGASSLPGFSTLVLCFAVYSFAGWVWETVYCSLNEHTFVRRGFLFGPYLPVYGFGAICVLIFVGWIRDPLELFLASVVICTILEYATGWLLEKLFHRRWWDYSGHALDIDGRVCLLSMVTFGVFSVMLVEVVDPLVVRACIDMLSPDLQIASAIFLLTVFLVDAVASTLRYLGHGAGALLHAGVRERAVERLRTLRDRAA